MTSNEMAAIRDLFDRLYTAWADGDADTFAALYTDDATVVLPGVFHKGQSSVRDYMAGAFAGPMKGSTGVDTPVDVRVLGDDTAIVVSRAGILMAGERELPADRERHATWVLSKRDGHWLVAAYANAPAH